MNVDQAIKAAQERVHRQIGQWTRYAHRKVRERATRERETMSSGLVRVVLSREVSGYDQDYVFDVPPRLVS